ncbi:hypothetical protein TI39_contig4547g00001, partial [Zymoseptoria brevis]
MKRVNSGHAALQQPPPKPSPLWHQQTSAVSAREFSPSQSAPAALCRRVDR